MLTIYPNVKNFSDVQYIIANYIQNEHTLENATHCGVSLSERLKSVVGFFQLFKTVSLPRMCPFSQYQDSVMGERIEVHANCELL